ncbi:MAG: hypothetical protein QME74_04920 [Candidatus Edwardsbacteria bacterium]|nr:hypothetical protein [Candidatus Edwardsbacteria bacterium]
MKPGNTVAKTKGTGISWLRELIEAKGPDADQAMARALSPEDYRAYRTAMPISWVPEESATRIFKAAGDILFADAPSPLDEVGRGMAKSNMTGIYSMLLKLTTIPFIMSQASRLWRTYHDSGDASVSGEKGANRAVLVVSGFPELPADMRQVLRGYVMGLGELTGAKNVKVALDESDPNAWKWVSTWE